METLKKTLESIVPTLNKQELDSRFPDIAKLLMLNYGVETSEKKIYLLNEIEFYYFDPLYDDMRTGNGKTRITYERNSQAGCWFIHSYGVDLTFKSEGNKYGGGILIRSVEEECNPKNVVIGPVNCVNELWDEAVDAFASTAPNPRIVRIPVRDVELDEADIRVTVGKVDKYQSNWRFTVKGKKVSKL